MNIFRKILAWRVGIMAVLGKIYRVLAETCNWPKWTVWNERDPNMTLDYTGATSGVGAKWAWQSKSEPKASSAAIHSCATSAC